MNRAALQFGAVLGLGIQETAAEAKWLEDLGYTYVGCGEHFMRGDPPSDTGLSLPQLAVAAGATQNIRLVSSVVLLPFYHPTVLAKVVATLDIASGGRLTLGVGVGGEFPMEFRAAGLDHRRRGARADECLDITERLLSGQRVDHRGRHYCVEDASLAPLPTQEPRPPVWVAGRREAAMRRSVRYGDGWFPYLYSPERYRDSVQTIVSLAGESGRDLAGFQWTCFQFLALYPTREEAARTAAAAMGGNYLYSGDFMDLVERYCVLGPAEECADRLAQYVDAGVRHFVFSWACPPEDKPRHMEEVASLVIPLLRGL